MLAVNRKHFLPLFYEFDLMIALKDLQDYKPCILGIILICSLPWMRWWDIYFENSSNVVGKLQASVFPKFDLNFEFLLGWNLLLELVLNHGWIKKGIRVAVICRAGCITKFKWPSDFLNPCARQLDTFILQHC